MEYISDQENGTKNRVISEISENILTRSTAPAVECLSVSEYSKNYNTDIKSHSWSCETRKMVFISLIM